MKFTIVTLSLILSTNLFAKSVYEASELSLFTSYLKVQAEYVIEDTQEMLQSGRISILLSQKIKEIQAANQDLSDAEALDILIETAEKVLSK